MDSIKSLLSLLYIFCVDYDVNGPTGRSEEVFDHLRTAYKNADPKYKKLLQPELDEAMRAAGQRPRAKAMAYAALGMMVKEIIPVINKDRGITQQQLDLFKAIGLYLRSDSETALAKMARFALQETGNHWIAQKMSSDIPAEQDDTHLRKLVKNAVGRNDNMLTTEELAKFRKTNPDLVKQYNAHRREYNQVAKDALQALVRQSGHSRIPFQQYEKYCKQNSIQMPYPPGFTGTIDDIGRWFTSEGQLISGVPTGSFYSKVVMNKDYGREDGNNSVFTAYPKDMSESKPRPFYTDAFVKSQAKQKFEKVGLLLPKIPAIQSNWMRYVKKFNIEDPKSVSAVILEIIYEFSARIGSPGNQAEGKDTFGISTLRVKNVYPQSNGDIVLRYLGKDAVKTVHKLRVSDPQQKYVVKAIDQMMEGKKSSDPLFTYDRGLRQIPVTATAVRQAFNSFGAPAGVSPHKLRTAKGTAVMQELIEQQLSKKSQPKTDKDALDILKKMAMQVGKILNHVRRTPTGEQTVTPATALQNYIDPIVCREFYDAIDMRYPKFLEKLVS